MAGRYGSAGSWGPDDFLIVSLFTITADLGREWGRGGEGRTLRPALPHMNSGAFRLLMEAMEEIPAFDRKKTHALLFDRYHFGQSLLKNLAFGK